MDYEYRQTYTSKSDAEQMLDLRNADYDDANTEIDTLKQQLAVAVEALKKARDNTDVPSYAHEVTREALAKIDAIGKGEG